MKRSTVTSIAFGLCLFTALTTYSAESASPRHKRSLEIAPAALRILPVATPSKIDAGLRAIIEDRSRIEPVHSAKTAARRYIPIVIEEAADGTAVVPLFLSTRDVEATKRAITAAGGSVSVVVKNTVVARLPIDVILELSERPEVQRIEPSHRSEVALDVSRGEFRIDAVHSGSGLPSAYTGRGVVVGIIDSGIDLAHPDFRDASGRSRILSVWDMSREGRPPAGFTHGFECTNAEINAGQCLEQDVNGHGTHVAGIAVGNGRGRQGTPFKGIAPEADIIFVKGFRTSGADGGFGDTDVIEGARYILDRAASLGKPAVINLSIQGQFGPHDGTSQYETSLTDLIGPGKQIVVSNGNAGADRIHLGYAVKGSSYETGWSTYWKVDPGTFSGLDLWSSSASFSVGIVARDAQERAFFQSPAVSSGRLPRTEVKNGATTVGFLSITTETTPSGSKHIEIEIDNNNDPSIDLSKVLWEFFTFGSGRIDGWIYVGGRFDPFSNPNAGFITGDFDMTVASPATARNVIAVGSYVTKTNWTDVDGRFWEYPNDKTPGKISSFSSRGPTRDNRTRPIISAPGQAIASALSAAVDSTSSDNRSNFLPGGGYQIQQGTSQAAPHIAGLVALMLQAKPSLTMEEAYSGLRNTARKDSETGPNRNNIFGDGKVDALEAVKTVAQAGPPIGPCVPDATTVCLNSNRFKTQIRWTKPDNTTGLAQAVKLTADAAYFWWESSDNIEVLVKVANACVPDFNRYWVFGAGLTNIKVDLTVTDTQTGAVWTRTNPLNTAFQPIQDTNAFACP